MKILVFTCFICIVLIIILLIQKNINKKLQIRITSLTSENIELEKNLEECKQTIKEFHTHPSYKQSKENFCKIKGCYIGEIYCTHYCDQSCRFL